MTSAEGYETFQGADPEGSPPVLHPPDFQGLVQERLGTKHPPAWSIAFSQAYRPSTLNVIAQEVLEAGKGGAVACVCCPSIFLALREAAPDVPCMLLDFNPLYQDLGVSHFTIYDCNTPDSVPEKVQHHYEVVVAETPYPVHPHYFLLTEVDLSPEARESFSLKPAGFQPRRRTEPHTSSWLYTNCRPSQRLSGWEEE
ncbi:hypothetical protein N2152v2_005915 [Parachlorella kessleri]